MTELVKTTGFLNYKRETGTKRPAAERVRDWQPIVLRMEEPKLKTQAARCMDCGTPFCHRGTLIEGMTTGCPINNLIPEWNDLVFQGLWREAYDRLARTNNFPEFTGLVCPAPCEAACTLGIIDPPVRIKSIEYAIIEKAFAEEWVNFDPPQVRTGMQVAVIGSGPAGLACADQLNLVGHKVTVFERADRIGGLLMYGIPNMKLDKHLVRRRIDLMSKSGINFVTKTEVGKDITAERLYREFDAVVLCTGATMPRELAVEGQDLANIQLAMPYLQASTKGLLDPGFGNGQAISAEGKDVIVIGGGDTGTDCVATALRQGCDSLVQFEILARPPDERTLDNPWPQWPRVYKMDYGQEEGHALYGRDPRRYAIMTRRFIGDDAGRVAGVETVDITWEPPLNGSGRPALKEIAGTERFWPAQLVLLALGFLGPEQGLLEQMQIERDGRSNIKADYGRYSTNLEGVFAAGDARRGQSLVVWAINEGRGAARECDRYLMGESALP